MDGKPREHHFQASEVSIGYVEWGELRSQRLGADQSVVLMVHATGFHARCWDKTVAALPPGTRVIGVDLRGHGRSENVGKIEDWNVPARDLAEFIEGLDLKNIKRRAAELRRALRKLPLTHDLLEQGGRYSSRLSTIEYSTSPATRSWSERVVYF